MSSIEILVRNNAYTDTNTTYPWRKRHRVYRSKQSIGVFRQPGKVIQTEPAQRRRWRQIRRHRSPSPKDKTSRGRGRRGTLCETEESTTTGQNFQQCAEAVHMETGNPHQHNQRDVAVEESYKGMEGVTRHLAPEIRKASELLTHQLAPSHERHDGKGW